MRYQRKILWKKFEDDLLAKISLHVFFVHFFIEIRLLELIMARHNSNETY